MDIAVKRLGSSPSAVPRRVLIDEVKIRSKTIVCCSKNGVQYSVGMAVKERHTGVSEMLYYAWVDEKSSRLGCINEQIQMIVLNRAGSRQDCGRCEMPPEYNLFTLNWDVFHECISMRWVGHLKLTRRIGGGAASL